MYAIIQARGRQIKVMPGAVIEVDGTAGEQGKEFTFDQVLLVEKDAGDIVAGAPFVANAKVIGVVDGESRGPKLRVFKYKPKKGYRRHTGFRAKLSEIEIQSIGGAARREAAPKKEVPVEAPAKLPRGYAEMTIADINEKSPGWSAEQVEAALEYERAHAARKGAIAALEAKREKES